MPKPTPALVRDIRAGKKTRESTLETAELGKADSEIKLLIQANSNRVNSQCMYTGGSVTKE